MAARPPAASVLTMKLLVDTKAQRVLYAEAGKEVVDLLFSLLSLPLSAVTKLLSTTAATTRSGSVSPSQVDHQLTVAAKHPTTTAGAMVGSVGNLYRSVESLDAGGHVWCRDAKDALLEPVILQLIAAAPSLPFPEGRTKIALAPVAPKPDRKLFRCKGCSCSKSCYDYATRVRGTPCPVCKGKMATEVQLVGPDDDSDAKSKAAAADEGSGSSSRGYVRDMVTYTVMDDLSIAPMSTITAVTALVSLGVTDISGLQAKEVEIGYKEGLALLKASLQSQTVLTDVFLGSNSKQCAS